MTQIYLVRYPDGCVKDAYMDAREATAELAAFCGYMDEAGEFAQFRWNDDAQIVEYCSETTRKLYIPWYGREVDLPYISIMLVHS